MMKRAGSVRPVRLGGYFVRTVSLFGAAVLVGLAYLTMREGENWGAVIAVSTGMPLLLVLLFAATISDAEVFADGEIRLSLAYIFRRVLLESHANDVVRLRYETCGDDDGVRMDFYVEIRDLGFVRLSGWSLQKATSLGSALGMAVERMKVSIPSERTVSVGRMDLKAWAETASISKEKSLQGSRG
jgi:hypothetical protein